MKERFFLLIVGEEMTKEETPTDEMGTDKAMVDAAAPSTSARSQQNDHKSNCNRAPSQQMNQQALLVVSARFSSVFACLE